MIVKMKKVSLLCLFAEKQSALEKLHDMSVMHVSSVGRKSESDDCHKLETLLASVDKAHGYLMSKEARRGAAGLRMNGEDLHKEVSELMEKEAELTKRLEGLERDRERLLPWGDFSQDDIRSLKARGIHVWLCSGPKADIEAVTPKNAALVTILDSKDNSYCAIVSDEEFDASSLPLAQIPPDTTLAEVENRISESRTFLKEINDRFGALARCAGELARHKEKISARLEFARNRDSMEPSSELTSISGYVPDDRLSDLREAASENGWGLLIEEPAEDDEVPTLITVPKAFKIIKPVFEFIGVLPGYHEWDISVAFLVFFSIFFGIIVGDAGYGLIFLALAVGAKIKFRGDEQMRLPINLFLTLSVSTVAWGFVTCTYFGLPYTVFPEWMRGVEPLSTSPIKDKYVQLVCFILAAVHLSLARLWRTILDINSVKCLGHVGWGLLIWANFFTAVKMIVFTDMEFPMLAWVFYGLGFLLVTVFSVDWTQLGEILNYPFGLIGSFVDVLSYIRLYAVGLSTYYIADCFNNIGKIILGVGSSSTFMFVVMFVCFLVLIVSAHLLNIFLALIAVLVHGIRLNTLEFSNQMGLQWLGYDYRPFGGKTRD